MNAPPTPNPDLTADEARGHCNALTVICGSEGVDTDESVRRLASQDLFFEGALPLAVVSPATSEQVARTVRHCAEHDIAICPRGGGMSYTDAFQPRSRRAIILDFGRLSRIREIAPVDGHVTVEAGCTWAALDKALAATGMRARFWGPMSGGRATIGGGLSQGSITFGSGVAGASGLTVKSFEIVTGAGEVIRTGSDGSAGTSPYNRNFGPDLTGIFANDAGALGIKTAATLEIEPRPALVDGLSFAFDRFEPMARMFAQVGLARLASEFLAMDAEVARQNTGPPDWSADAKALWRIGRSAGGALSAAVRMARVATGGRRFLANALYTAHFVVEGRDRGELKSRLAAIRALATGGREIVNTVPLAIRAAPFPELALTHPDGRRMLPIHGVFAASQVTGFHAQYLEYKRNRAAEMREAGVTIAEFFAGIAGIGMLYEPVFTWPDTRNQYIERRNPAYLAASIRDYPPNPEGRELVRDLVSSVIALMRDHGSTHFQLGRLYPYIETREAGAGGLVRDLKRQLDPHGILNPGALGL